MLSLYSPTLEPKELTNGNDLTRFFYGNGNKICECSVDFGPVSSAYRMFYGCSSLSALPVGFSASNVTNASYMFYNCSSLSSLPDSFNVPSATNTGYMFSGCSSLSALSEGFSCPNVIKAGWMFENCSSLSSLPNGFSVPNATITRYMFRNCSSLSALPDGFSAPNMTNHSDMFIGCSSLSAIGHNVKIANGTGMTSGDLDNARIDKSLITSIGDNFEWFTKVKFNGTWDPSKGIRNVFPNVTSVGPGWKVYNHYDGE